MSTHTIPRNLRDLAEVLGEETSVEEVFWNFSRLEGNQRITLQQNPYFYKGLPRSARAYSHEFTAEPIENFQDETEILVLVDKQSRLFLETGEIKRVFGNFWVPDEAIIFKGQRVVHRLQLLMHMPDIHGRLMGERVVAADIKTTPHLWIRMEPSVTPGDRSPGNPLNNGMFKDWRQLVRESLGSPNVSICISTKNAPPEGNWVSRTSLRTFTILTRVQHPAYPSTRELARASVSPQQPLAQRVSKISTRPQPQARQVYESSAVRPQPTPQPSAPPVINQSHTSNSPPPSAVLLQTHSGETWENATPSIIAPATPTTPAPMTTPIHHFPRDSNRRPGGGRLR